MIDVGRGWWVISVIGVRRMVRGRSVRVGVDCAVAGFACGSAAVGVGVAGATIFIVRSGAAVGVGVG